MPERSSGPRPKGRHRRKRHVEQHHHHDGQRTTSTVTVREDCGVVHAVHTVAARMERILDFALEVGVCRRDQSTDVSVWAVAA